MRVAIVGGGIAGLAAAHKILEIQKEKNLNIEVSLFEAGAALGGTLESEARDGFLLEKGPDAFISERPAVLELCKRLGIESQVLGTNSLFRKGFILREKKLLSIPEGFYLIAPTNPVSFFQSPLLSWRGKFRMMSELFIPPMAGDKDESIASFVRRRFGEETLIKIGQPMLSGVYTGDPELLSLSCALPRFRQLEKEYGSVIRGLLSQKKKKGGQAVQAASGPRYSLFLSFKNGMQTLPDAITQKLPASWLRLNRTVQTLRKDENKKEWLLSLKEGGDEAFDAVCLAVSSKIASRITADLSRTFSQKLSSISFESVATLNLAYKAEHVRHPMDGFGFVVPAIENSPIVACTFTHAKFTGRAPEGSVLLRAFIGGAFGRKHFSKSDKELEKDVQSELAGILGIQARPIFTALKRYADSMVQYRVGHKILIESIEKELEKYSGLFLTGSSYRGVGVPDCIADAEKQAARMLEYARPAS